MSTINEGDRLLREGQVTPTGHMFLVAGEAVRVEGEGWDHTATCSCDAPGYCVHKHAALRHTERDLDPFEGLTK